MPEIPVANVVAQPVELSYVSLAGDEVLPATRENVHLLQHAADFAVSVRNLRVSGFGDIFWGVLCCVLGGIFLRANSWNWGLLGLGAILIGVGSWIALRPSPAGMIVDGITLLLVAAWNLMINIENFSMNSRRSPAVGPIIIIAQVFWGIHRLRAYRRFASAVAMQPSAAAVKWLNDLAKVTLKAKPAKDPAAIEFLRRGAITYERWKGRLLPEIAVFTMTQGTFGGRRDVLLASRDGIDIVSQKKKLLRNKFSLTLRVGQRELKVVMPAASFEKLKTWMNPDSGTVARAALPV